MTQVPVADPNYYCSPKLAPDERTFWRIFARAMSVLIGLGLKINGRHTLCGDYIYSGHTIVHVICYLFIRECKQFHWTVGRKHSFFRQSPPLARSPLALLPFLLTGRSFIADFTWPLQHWRHHCLLDCNKNFLALPHSCRFARTQGKGRVDYLFYYLVNSEWPPRPK